MLDRQFLARFFPQIEAFTEAELEEKIEHVERLMKTLNRGTEAALDAKFLLRHLRREKLDRLFRSPGGTA